MTTKRHDCPLFAESTREEARRVAAAMTATRYRQIIQVLAEQPLCIFEVAERLGRFDHQISGRFGELVKLGLIEKTGERRRKPSTGCSAEVYRIAGDVIAEGVAPESPAAEGRRA